MTIAEELKSQGIVQGREQGIVQGREQGIVQGREQGLVLGLRQTLERQMTLKFGPLSDAVSARIRTAGVDELNRWLERIFAAHAADAVVEL